MLRIIMPALLLFGSISSFAQKDDCKFTKMKFTDGTKQDVITVASRIGKFFVGKKVDTLFAFYMEKGIFQFATETKNRITIKTDSIQFVFTDRTTVTVAAPGTGIVENAVKLTPQFEDMHFSFVIPASKIKMFMEKKLVGFKLTGEKSAEGADSFTDAQADVFARAITCFSSK